MNMKYKLALAAFALAGVEDANLHFRDDDV